MKGLIYILFLMCSFFTFGQLPEGWIGHYSGELTTTNIEGNQMSYHMEMDISVRTDSSYNFIIIYGKDSTRQERKYVLERKKGNHYILDEQNSILLDMTLTGNRLTSVFDVQNNLLHVSYIRTKKGMRFELTSSIHADETGGGTIEDEEIPIVYSFKTTVFQSAILKKKKN